VLSGWSALSHVTGTERQMISLQRSSTHYFQRPDAGHVEWTPAPPRSAGSPTRWWLNKERERVLFNAGAGYVDPGFEINDLGFQRRSDIVNGHVGSGYKWTKPRLFWRYQTLKGTLFTTLDNGGNVTRPRPRGLRLHRVPQRPHAQLLLHVRRGGAQQPPHARLARSRSTRPGSRSAPTTWATPSSGRIPTPRSAAPLRPRHSLRLRLSRPGMAAPVPRGA
jgi:hypothetical protein